MHFADVQVFIESETSAHAYLAVELTHLDRGAASNRRRARCQRQPRETRRRVGDHRGGVEGDAGRSLIAVITRAAER